MTDNAIKLVLVGDGFVGKTALRISYAWKKFDEEYLPTVFDNDAVTVMIAGEPHTIGIFDTSGQDEDVRLRLLSYPQTDVFLVCFSVVNPASFAKLKEKPSKLKVLKRVAFGAINIAKDLMNGIGYLLKATSMQPLKIWELGFTWFLGIYTLAAMLSPLIAYVAIFQSKSVDKNKNTWHCYMGLSIVMTPITSIVSSLHSLKNDAMFQAADCAHDVERATEASINLVVQLVALSSGVITEDDYLVNFTTLTGTPIKIFHQRDLAWFSFCWSLHTMMMLCMKNNNVYEDLIARENAKRTKLSKDRQTNGVCKKILTGFQDVFWTLKLHGKFRLAPIVKTCPSLLFRVLCYSILLSYLSNFYSGMGLLFPLGLFAIPAFLSFLVGKYILGIKDAEVVVNSVSGIVLPIYIDLFDVESEKCEKPVEIAKSEEIDTATPKMLDRWHNTWHRDKKDLRTRFINMSTMVGNLFLLIALCTVLGLVNHNMLCIPDTLLLNPSAVNIPGCNQSSHINSTQNGHFSSEEPTTFYELNWFILCVVCPLGFASILVSLSEHWLPKVQKLRWVIKARRSVHLEVDGILAISAIISSFIFAAFLYPVAINSTRMINTMPCYTELILNIISTIVLFAVGCPSLFFSVKNISIVAKGKKEMKTRITEQTQEIYESEGDAQCHFLVKMLTSFFMLAVLLVITPLHFWETNDLLTWSEEKSLCNRSLDLHRATVVLHATDVIILLLTLFLSVFYTIQYILYQKMKKAKRSNDPESIPLNSIH